MRDTLQRVPLRTKLIVLVLALLTVAIGLIGVASVMAMRRYLNGHIDSQLQAIISNVEDLPPDEQPYFTPPTSTFYIDFHADAHGKLIWPRNWDKRPVQLLPKFPDNPNDLLAYADDGAFTMQAPNGAKWRLLATRYSDGRLIVAAQSVSDIDELIRNLIWINIYGGASVLLFAATIGAELIRRSFKPLGTIERTAGKIAEGDLSQRVPDPEEGAPVARTEVGSLARSLNAMLTRVESAFTAQAASEAEARKSEDRMRRFVADASHELRTPLTTIRGFAELYRQGAVTTPERTAEVVKRIEDEAARMGLLVEDLLLLARLDRERPFKHQPVELRVLAAEAVQAARVMAPNRRVELVTAPDAGLLVVEGDDARLRQIIGNLMSNALAHTPAGTPVTLALRSESPQSAVIEIIDEGPGLDPDQRDRVFERFYRADAARTRKTDGSTSTGLGLAIVAALVAAHDGTVEVDSEPGKGATFRVRLPLSPEDPEV